MQFDVHLHLCLNNYKRSPLFPTKPEKDRDGPLEIPKTSFGDVKSMEQRVKATADVPKDSQKECYSQATYWSKSDVLSLNGTKMSIHVEGTSFVLLLFLLRTLAGEPHGCTHVYTSLL